MACDLCGGEGKPLHQYPACHICQSCGFLFVPERRDPASIAADWTSIYESGQYDPTWPGVRARLFYVAEWLDQNIGLKGKSVLDIGAGDGFFLEQVRARGGHPVGLEPDGSNIAKIRAKDIYCFEGHTGDIGEIGQYDLVTINWTLENCGDCLEMLRFAKRHAPMVSVATGSRILVPFKKPLNSYFGTAPADLHCFRWSWSALSSAFLRVGLRPNSNDWWQNDVLLSYSVGIVKPCNPEAIRNPRVPDDDVRAEQLLAMSNPAEVQRFFDEWERYWP